MVKSEKLKGGYQSNLLYSFTLQTSLALFLCSMMQSDN